MGIKDPEEQNCGFPKRHLRQKKSSNAKCWHTVHKPLFLLAENSCKICSEPVTRMADEGHYGEQHLLTQSVYDE